jgi:hypothetical protein
VAGEISDGTDGVGQFFGERQSVTHETGNPPEVGVAGGPYVLMPSSRGLLAPGRLYGA